MVIKLIRNAAIPFLTLWIITSSIVLQITPMPLPLLTAGGLFLCCILLERDKSLHLLQFVFLGLFHYFSQLNWCEVLYFLLIGMNVQKFQRYTSAIVYSVFFMIEYSAIRLAYMPVNPYNLLVTAYDIVGIVLFISIVQYVIRSEQVSVKLQEHTHYLTTHDPLTGLLNYEGFLGKIQDLVDNEHQFVLINLDLHDFKSFNTSSFHNGNEILMKLSSTLKKMFKDALALSRYAGDRFAIVLPNKEGLADEIQRVMNSKQIGFQVTYSVTHFPEEAASASMLISLAEDRLFQNKRNTWLIQEEKRFQEEKLRMVGELAAGMAHEIRNPLTTIKGFMQLSKTNDYSMKPWFEVVMGELSRMSELTAEFLQFAKPHISNMKVESIQDCINRVLFLTESEASLHGHVVESRCTPEKMDVRMDRDKIVQVLLNLIRNAFEAMKQSGTVRVRVYRKQTDCVIEIEDNGSGISEADLGKIFDPFYTTKENGTGLGLSICKKIIQDHQGDLTASSTPGEGSVFTVSLPVV